MEIKNKGNKAKSYHKILSELIKKNKAMTYTKYTEPYLNVKSKSTHIMEKLTKQPKMTELRKLVKVRGLKGYSTLSQSKLLEFSEQAEKQIEKSEQKDEEIEKDLDSQAARGRTIIENWGLNKQI